MQEAWTRQPAAKFSCQQRTKDRFRPQLGRLLLSLFPTDPEVFGLLALMLLQQSRAPARFDANGEIVLLNEQDRSRWNRTLINEGRLLLERAAVYQNPGPYQLQAAIAALHARATRPEDALWKEIDSLYQVLEALQPSPVVTLIQGTTLVEFQSSGNTLRGFIDLPESTDKHPAILIVHGGVDTDVTVDPYYQEMRHAFRAAGIATVIWDKAGNGCSSGRYSSALPLQERASETLAAIAMLKKRDDIDTHRIGLWALSQGGWVAPMAAIRSSEIAYLIVVSGPGRDSLSQGVYPSMRLLRDSGIDEAEARKVYVSLRRGLAILRAGGTADEAVSACKSLEQYPALRPTYPCDEASVRTLQALLKDPAWSVEAGEFLRQMHQPTLAIFGKHDAVVDWRESIDVYRSAFEQSGNRDLTVKVFDEADHEMLASSKQHSPDSIFVRGYIETMIRWLEARAFTAMGR
jgi:alpha-beta hydrolase superfamily lysophospholipase